MKNMNLGECLNSSFLLIGLGRLGVHFKKHLEECFVGPISLCAKSDDIAEQIKINEIKYVFLAVPDLEIEPYIKQIPEEVKIIHFSGFYYNEKALGVHPVQSFSKEGEYDFSEIEFVVDGKLDEVLKKIFKKTLYIKPENKKMYHTYISVAANSTQLLMNRLGEAFTQEVGLSDKVLKGIVLQSLQREMSFGEESFSGPWTRGESSLQKEQVEISKDKNLKELNNLFENLIGRYRDERTEV
ncbi:MAG: DUF2520 domain-containing protein [Bdellovibrionales bacterium]